MTNIFINYGTWSKTPFCISNVGVVLQRVMQKIPAPSSLPSTSVASYYGWKSRDDTI